MSQTVFGAPAVVTMLNRAFNNASPANAVFNNQVAEAGTTDASQIAFANAFGASFAGLSDAALSAQVLGNLGVLPNAELEAAVTQYFADNGLANRGLVVLQLGQILSTLETAPAPQDIFNAAAAAWNTEVEKSFIYSSNSANTTAYVGDFAPTPVDQGQTYTLTTGQDNVQGTGGNDKILGVFDAGATSNQNTLTAADVINGGAGKDSLMATLANGAAGVLPAAQYSNLENFFIRNVSGTNGLGADNAIGGAGVNADTETFNFATVTGEEQVWNDRSTNSVLFTNLAAGTTVGVKGEGTVVAATGATYVATATAANIALDGGLAATAGAATGGVNIAGVGLRSATVTSTNGTNNISSLTLAGTVTSLTVDAQSNFAITDGIAATAEGIAGAGLTSITVQGAGSANLGTLAIPNAIATVDASANTGGVTLALNGGTAASNGLTFKGGSGNDVVTTNGGGGTLLTTASIDAGAGSADRLVVANTADILIGGAPLSRAQGDLYKGFEQVQVQNGVSVNLDLLATNNTIDAVRINDGIFATGVTNLSATGAQNVTILAADSANGAITIGVKGATTTGQIDTVKAAVATTTTTGAPQPINLAGIVLTGVENLELTGSNGADKTLVGNVTLTTAAATDLSSIKLNNGNVVDTNAGNNNAITVAAGQAAINLTIDATGSGDTTVNAAAYNTATGARITTGAGNDVIQGSVRSDVVVAGDGDDIIQGDVALTVLQAGTPEVRTITIGNAEQGDVFNIGATQVVWTSTDAINRANVKAAVEAQVLASTGVAVVADAANVAGSAGTVTVTGPAAGTSFTLPTLTATNRAAASDTVTLNFAQTATWDGTVGAVTGDAYTVQINAVAVVVAATAADRTATQFGNDFVTAFNATTLPAGGYTAVNNAGVVTVTGPLGVNFGFTGETVTSKVGNTAQVSTVTFTDGDWTTNGTAGFIGVSVNGTSFTQNVATATEAGAETAATLLVNQINAANVGVTAAVANGGVDNIAGLTLTASNAGTAFVATASQAGAAGTAPTPNVTLTTPNDVANSNAGGYATDNNTSQTAGATNTQSISSPVAPTTPGVPQVVIGGNPAADSLTGGAGNDTFVVLGGAGDNGSTFTTMDTITDLNLGGSNQAGRVDVIDLNPGVASTITALVNTGQPVAMNAQAASLSAAVNGLFTVGATLATAVNGTAGLFTYNNDTYLIALNGGAVGAFDGNDTIIKVTGVAGTLDLSDFI